MNIMGLQTVSNKSCCEFTPEGNKLFSFVIGDIKVYLELYQSDFFEKGFYTIFKEHENMFNGYGIKQNLLDDILNNLDFIITSSWKEIDQ